VTTPATDLPDWITSVGGSQQTLFNTFATTNDVPVNQYQAVLVRVQNLNGTTPLVVRYSFRSLGGQTLDQGVLSADMIIGAPTWSLPVLGPVLRIENLTGQTMVVTVTGLPIARNKRMMFDFVPIRQFQATIPNASPNGTITQLPGLGSSLDATFPDQSCYNGQVTYVLSVSALNGATGFNFRAQLRMLNGTTQQIVLNSVGGIAPVLFAGGHPFGFVTWWVQNTGGALTGNVTASIVIFPAETV
jgi:hypothetical protein